MSSTLNLPPEVMERIKRDAARRGVPPEECVVRVLGGQVPLDQKRQEQEQKKRETEVRQAIGKISGKIR